MSTSKKKVVRKLTVAQANGEPIPVKVSFGCGATTLCCPEYAIDKCVLLCNPDDPQNPQCKPEVHPCLYPGDGLEVDYQITVTRIKTRKLCLITTVTFEPAYDNSTNPPTNIPYVIADPIVFNVSYSHDDTFSDLGTITVPGGQTVGTSSVDVVICGCIDLPPDVVVTSDTKFYGNLCDNVITPVSGSTELVLVDCNNELVLNKKCTDDCVCLYDPTLTPDPIRVICESDLNSDSKVVITLPRIVYEGSPDHCLPEQSNTATINQYHSDTSTCGDEIARATATVKPRCTDLSLCVETEANCKLQYCGCKKSEVDEEHHQIHYELDLDMADTSKCTWCAQVVLNYGCCTPQYDTTATLTFNSGGNTVLTVENIVLDHTKVVDGSLNLGVYCLDAAVIVDDLVTVEVAINNSSYNISTCFVNHLPGTFTISTDVDVEFPDIPVTLCDTLTLEGDGNCSPHLSNDDQNTAEGALIVAALIANFVEEGNSFQSCLSTPSSTGDDPLDTAIDNYFNAPYPLFFTLDYAGCCGCLIVRNKFSVDVGCQEIDCDSDATSIQHLENEVIDKLQLDACEVPVPPVPKVGSVPLTFPTRSTTSAKAGTNPVPTIPPKTSGCKSCAAKKTNVTVAPKAANSQTIKVVPKVVESQTIKVVPKVVESQAIKVAPKVIENQAIKIVPKAVETQAVVVVPNQAEIKSIKVAPKKKIESVPKKVEQAVVSQKVESVPKKVESKKVDKVVSSKKKERESKKKTGSDPIRFKVHRK